MKHPLYADRSVIFSSIMSCVLLGLSVIMLNYADESSQVEL
jgi:hypothetical protein